MGGREGGGVVVVVVVGGRPMSANQLIFRPDREGEGRGAERGVTTDAPVICTVRAKQQTAAE